MNPSIFEYDCMKVCNKFYLEKQLLKSTGEGVTKLIAKQITTKIQFWLNYYSYTI